MLGFTALKNRIIGSNEKYLGDLIQRLQHQPVNPIGYTMTNKTVKVPFVKTHNIVTGASILNIPSGVWSICFGWKMSADGDIGDGTNYNVTYGLSKSPTGFELLEINGLYNIFYEDSTTFQSHYQCVVLVFKKNTTIYLNAFINNETSFVDTTMVGSYINATLISQ
jgi:hypothetical protein